MQNTENQNNNNKNTVINNVTNNYYVSQDSVQIESSMNTETKMHRLKKWTGILAVIATILAMVLEIMRSML